MATLRSFVAVVAVALGLVWTATVHAFDVPAMQGHVNDVAGKLTTQERADLERRMEAINRAGGAELAVLVLPTLGDEAIEDVAYQTFNAWQLGKKGEDNGVLLVIAERERRVRFETGRGIGGDLTDLQTNDIIRRRIAPLLREDRWAAAIGSGVDGVAAALGVATEPTTPPQEQDRGGSPLFWLIPLLVLLFLFRAAASGFFPAGLEAVGLAEAGASAAAASAEAAAGSKVVEGRPAAEVRAIRTEEREPRLTYRPRTSTVANRYADGRRRQRERTAAHVRRRPGAGGGGRRLRLRPETIGISTAWPGDVPREPLGHRQAS